MSLDEELLSDENVVGYSYEDGRLIVFVKDIDEFNKKHAAKLAAFALVEKIKTDEVKPL